MHLLRHYPFINIFLGLLCLLFLNQCSQSHENLLSKLKISLVDSPGDYEQVNIEITEAQIKLKGGDWTTLTGFKQGVYNLLDYTSGNELILTDQDMPSALIEKIRLILGANNSVVIAGSSYLLNIPSGQESGVIILVNQMLEPGKDIKLLIDFDASRSVVKSVAGIYLLRPLITAYTESSTGSIAGNVFPEELNIAVQVNSNNKIVATSYSPKGTSSFIVSGLPEGVYMVIFDPGSESGYQQYSTEENIVVQKGKQTSIGTITLQPNIK